MRIPIVGVICSGTRKAGKPARRAREIGEWLATERVHLLTGGGQGLMAVVSSAFHAVPDRDGLVIGIVPCEPSDPARPKHGYPNRWVEIPIYTRLPCSGAQGTDPLSRNHINVLTSDVLSEIVLALKYQPRVVAAYLADRSEIPGLPEEVPVFDELREIQAFVRSALKRAPK